MLLLMIMLFMIGQALNMSAVFWIFWWIMLIVQVVKLLVDIKSSEPSYLEKRMADKIDSTIDDITNKVSKEE